MVYGEYTMRRTQVYLTEEQGRLLKSRSRATGCTVSELIRAAIDRVYAPRRELTVADRVRLARRTAGTWKGSSETGAEYVERIRGSRRLQTVEREAVPTRGLGTAIHELFKPFGGVELEMPPRGPMREPPRFD